YPTCSRSFPQSACWRITRGASTLNALRCAVAANARFRLQAFGADGSARSFFNSQHAAIFAVANQQAELGMERDAVRAFELHFQRRATDAGRTLLASAGHADDRAVGRLVAA